MINLRTYQNKIIDKIQDFFKKGGKSSCIVAPTGAGKTIIFSYIGEKIALKNNKVLIFTDRTELLTQAGGSLRKFGIVASFIQAGTKYLNPNSNVYIAMSQTFRNRMESVEWLNFLKSVDLIVIDECHKQEFNYLFESGHLKSKRVLGFTATPSRSGSMRQMALDYEEIIDEVSVRDLIDLEYLVADEYYGVEGVDLNNIAINKLNGDYDERDLFKRFNSPQLYSGAFKQWKNIAYNTPTLVFCVNIEHCIKTCEEFQKNGIDAKFLVSKPSLPKQPEDGASAGKWVMYEEKMRLYELYKVSFGKWSGDRDRLIKDFKNKGGVLINAGILTTGFDAPNVETILCLRATQSVSLWLQIIGRGSRILEGKTHFNILDFGENAKRLGHYSQPRLWSLWHSPPKEGGGNPPVKECGDEKGNGCNRFIMASYKICPFCGYKYPTKKEVEAELVAAAFNSYLNRTEYIKPVSKMNDSELEEYRQIKGHKQAWLWRQLWFNGGDERLTTFAKNKGWSKDTLAKARNFLSNK